MVINNWLQKKYFPVYLMVFLFLMVNSFYLSRGIYYFAAFPILLILIWIAFTALDKFLIITVFFVPISIQLSSIIGKHGTDLSIPSEPFLVLILLLVVLKHIMHQEIDYRILKHPVSIALYFYLIWTLITSLTSSMPVVSFKHFTARLWFVCGFYFLAAQVFQRRRNFLRYLLAYTIPLTFIIVYVIFKHADYGLTNHRASAFVVKPFFNDHTAYGAALAMMIPVLVGSFCCYFRKLTVLKRILFLFLILLFLVAVLFSYSRAAWISLIAASLICLIIILRIRWEVITAGIIILLLTGYAFRTELLILAPGNKQPSSSGSIVNRLQSSANIRNDDSNLERINRWSCAWRMFREKPLSGWGPGTYMFNYAPFQLSSQKTAISTNAGTRGNAHSEYLGVLSESGLPGLISFIVIIFLTLFSGFRVYYHARKRQIKILVLAVLLSLITYYIHGFLNNFLDTDKLSALFWGFTAIIVAFDIRHRREAYFPEN